MEGGKGKGGPLLTAQKKGGPWLTTPHKAFFFGGLQVQSIWSSIFVKACLIRIHQLEIDFLPPPSSKIV